MATIILQAAGAALGGLFGSTGAAIGTAAGALAGYVADRALLAPSRRLEGPRLGEQRPFTAEEGAALPRVYGSVRVSGTLIWATRYEEDRQTKRQGGKGGGTKTTEYSYFANAAFALCEGEIAGVRRVWADGVELDREQVEMRVYRGTEDQAVDPLVSVKQGAGNAPAYRGTAYVVIERMAIGNYGNRLPQMQFEVLRPVGLLARRTRAVTLIPGSTEYGLSTQLVTREKREGEAEALNRHVLHAGTDVAASLDELQMLCPALEHVALVVSWFGNDLRAAQCTVRPGVTTRDAGGLSAEWRVSGATRADALLVSMQGGGAAYGGTPTDASVVQAIQEIKARGLKVTLYPFMMMDVAPGNGLTDPYGAAEQAAYPWRGRITVAPAPGRTGSPDKSAAARTAVNAFSGSAAPGNFSISGTTVAYSGSDWGYRRLVLHYAKLAAAAGGVDAFLIGSELRGLTRLRDGAGAFTFVEVLCALAADARTILGASTKITYGADWSEYFGYQPADGSGDVFFNLDPLWAHPAINAVGIDNYMPLADWRDEDYAGGNPDGAVLPSDPAALRAGIAGGEGFDWFYPSDAARGARTRTAITDGAYGKPWVFRTKDLKSWWSNQHRNRPGGVEQAATTAWVPQSKPIWFTELGCPAIDKGANQPNVFSDPKSAESAFPYFSSGGRSDTAQRRFLEAHLSWWDEADADFLASANPVSGVYGGRMVDRSRVYLWAWDARPFPAFPLRSDIWSDNGNWLLGHWLNGRLEAPAAGDLVNAVLADYGLPSADASAVEGGAQGYILDPQAPREAIEPILDVFGIDAFERAGRFVLRAREAGGAVTALADLVVDDKAAVTERTRGALGDLPAQAQISFRDALADYQAATAQSMWLGAGGIRQEQVGFPGVLDPRAAAALIEAWLRRRRGEREQLRFALAPQTRIEPGSLLRLDGRGDAVFRVSEVERGLVQQVTAREALRGRPSAWRAEAPVANPPQPTVAGRPRLLLMDLPAAASARADEEQFRVALWQRPWRRQLVYASPETTGFTQRASAPYAANLGALVEALPAGESGRFGRAVKVKVEFFGGEASSVSRLALFRGANALAVRAANGAWEILQFEQAEETAAGVFTLSNLLRGQLGTEDAMRAGAAAGADAVMLDDAVVPAGLLPGEAGLALNWRAGPAGFDFSDRYFASKTATGGVRAKLPLSPVHLKAWLDGAGGFRFGWTRRGRLDADAWGAGDIPLGEEREAYLVEVAAAGGAVVRSATVTDAAWQYAAVAVAGDFATLPSALDLTARQMGTGVGPGLPATRRFTLAALTR